MNELLDKYKDVTLSLPAVPVPYLDLCYVAPDVLVNQTSVVSNIQYPFAVTPAFDAQILSSTIIAGVRPEDDVKRVYKLKLQLPEAYGGHTYYPGDTIGVIASNHPDEVDEIFKRLTSIDERPFRVELRDNDPTSKKSLRVPLHIPAVTTAQTLIAEHLDLHGVIKKLFLRALTQCTAAAPECRFLEILCSKEGAADYTKLIVENRMGLPELLQLCPSCVPPLYVLIEHLPRLLPRPYSIANSPLTEPTTLTIVFSMPERGARGIATSHLEALCEAAHFDADTSVRIYFRQRTLFSYPASIYDRNVVLIGCGTSVAPFVAFLEQRAALKDRVSFGEAWLLAGCRYRHKNNLFKEQLEKFVENRTLNRHLEAFSRDHDANKDSPKYVQDLIRANSSDFIDLISTSNAMIFVCGGGRTMAQSIVQTIIDCVSITKGVAAETAKNWLQVLRTDGRYVEDLWT